MTVRLENEALIAELSSFGGNIHSIVNKATGNEHYWKYDSSVWPRNTNICFPICDGLTGGEYSYEGKRYSLPVHGFLREFDFALKEQRPDKVVFAFESCDATREIYPFEFLFTLTQELVGNSLCVHYTVENTGSGDMYYSVGSHYFYKVPINADDSYEDYEFLFAKPQNAGKIIVTQGQMDGKTEDIFQGADRFALSGFFDDGSTILDLADIYPHEITISSTRGDAGTKVRFEGFEYCVLWAPKGQYPFVCIEPWSGMLDQKGHDGNLKNKHGIKKLSGGCKNHYKQTITAI